MKKYIVEMDEIINNDVNNNEVVKVWNEFYEWTNDLDEAKQKAKQLFENIKENKVSEVLDAKDADDCMKICIYIYNEETDALIDVIEIGKLSPKEWNITCGSCGAYCTEGTCFKYGSQVNEDTIADDCWHSMY